MTAAIAAPTETSEPLAPAGQAAPGRGPAGAFDVLIALLQSQLPAMPGMPTSVVATPVPGGAIRVSPLVNDAAPADTDAAGTLQAATALGVLAALVPGDATSDAVLTAEDDEETDGVTDLSAQAVAAALVGAIVPRESEARVPLASPKVGSEDGGPAGEITLSPGPGIGLVKSEAVIAEVAEAVDASMADGIAGDEPLTPPDAGVAAALEPRSRSERSMRTVDAFRAAEAAAALASVREDVAQRLGAAGAMTRVPATPEALVDRFGGPVRDTEREPNAPNGDGAVGTAPLPGSALAPRDAAEITESSRPEPVRDPIDQIATRLREVRGPGRHEISVRLDPPELGAVRIDARLEGARLSLQIVAEHAPTSELLADALPRLRETLAQQGFVPTAVTVHLGFEAAGRQFTRDDAPTFTPPRDGELAPASPVVRLPAARAALASDGLDVWA